MGSSTISQTQDSTLLGDWTFVSTVPMAQFAAKAGMTMMLWPSAGTITAVVPWAEPSMDQNSESAQ